MHRYSKEYRKFRVGLACALATPALAFASMSGAAAATLAASAGTLIAPVPRTHVTDLGLLPRATRVAVAVTLNYRNEHELEALIAATSDPRSPEYGDFLTPAQFAGAFAPAAADYSRVATTLARAGFTITRTSSTRTVINASASAPVAEAFFHTVFHAVRQDKVGIRYANAAPAYVPAAIGDVTYGVAGLNNLVVAKTHNIRAATRRTDLALGPPLQGPDTGLSPFALASAYDFPIQHKRAGGNAGQTYDGTGHAAGIAIDSDFANSDLSSFLSFFNIKRSGGLARVKVDGGADINGDGVETLLDLETIAGLAPGAGVFVYLMPDLSTQSIVDTYARVVEDNKVDVVNSSFGGCEISGDNFSGLTDHVAKQGNAEGITFTASSGDLGAFTCLFETNSGLGVSAPASSPNFTAVGGTSLLITSAGAYNRELAWSGSGGGISTIFGLPSFQKGVHNIIGSTRNVPDISFDANPGTGASLFYDGAFQGPIGGTSLSSPIFSALITEYNETVGKRSGNLNYGLYALFSKLGYGTRFRDITIGNNSLFAPGYNALPGYDDVTGIGSGIGTAHAR